MDDPWVGGVLEIVQSVFMVQQNRSADERAICAAIVSEVLLYLAPENIFGSKRSPWNQTRKDFGYHLIKFLTIDLTASFSQLHALFNSSEYAPLADLQATNFDIISKFLLYLLQSEDIESIGMGSEYILKLREDMDVTFRLSIEFLRDRWNTVSSTTSKKLACGPPQNDKLVLSVIRALSIWLSEGGSVCTDAEDLTDALVGLWPASSSCNLDFRPWIVGTLHSILENPESLNRFIFLDGPRKICADLLRIYRTGPGDDAEILKGNDEARLLLSLMGRNKAVAQPLQRDVLVTLTAGYCAFQNSPLGLGLSVSLLQVAVRCISTSVERKNLGEIADDLANWVEKKGDQLEDWVKREIRQIRDEIRDG